MPSTPSREYPGEGFQALYEAQKVQLDPTARIEALQELYVKWYKNASWLFLHESQDAVLMRKNVEWDTGTAGIRGEGNLSIIKVFNV